MVLWPIVVSTLAAAVLALPLCKRWPRGGPLLLALQPLVSFVLLVRTLPSVGAGITSTLAWESPLGVRLVLFLDGVSLVFALLVTGIGGLVLVYAGAYLRESRHLPTHCALLLAFAAAMLVLVFADDLVLLFVAWEATGVVSWLLIGTHAVTERRAREAANQAFVVTAFGGLALLVGLLLIWDLQGTTRISALEAGPFAASPLAFPIVVLVVLGAFAKSAQFPFHFWLPAAMEAPTPTSAYLHSATLVNAGVYLLARLSPVLSGVEPWAVAVPVGGVLTMLIGAWGAMRATDLKRVLAYATVVLLGALVLLIGIGTPVAFKAMFLLLVAHACYKAALFMVAGAVERVSGTRELATLRHMEALRRRFPFLALTAGVAAFSLAALPASLAYHGKEAFLGAVLDGAAWQPAATALGAVGLAGLVAVALRLMVGPFFDAGRRQAVVRRLPLGLVVPPFILGGVALLLGVLPALLVAPWLDVALVASTGSVAGEGLHLWGGWQSAAWTAGIFAAGTVIWWALRGRGLNRMEPVVASGSDVYDRIYDAVHEGAVRFTRRIQAGRLSLYVGIVTVVAAVAGLLPVWGVPLSGVLPATGDLLPHEVLLLAVLALVATFVLWTRSGFAAVVGVGVLGYGIALVFLLAGAPDVAMAQLLFETLVTLLFLLIVPRLAAAKGTQRPRTRRIAADLVAVAFGLMLTLGTLHVLADLGPREMAEWYGAEAAPTGRGDNVVNVILTDFRVADTLGEVMVLVVAGIGVYVLLGSPYGMRRPAVRHPFRSRPLVLRTLAEPLIALLLLLSFFLLWRGHDAPGGGFVGGLVAAGAVALHALAHGATATRQRVASAPERAIPAGIALILLAASVGLVVQGGLLAPLWVQPWAALPSFGTPLLFEWGVYVLSFGVASMALLRIGEVP